MGTLGTRARNGKNPAPRRVERTERPHPAIAKLALAQKDLKKALEQQAATAEILRALSRSSGDPQPVFEAIVEHAHRLCGAVFSILYSYDGRLMSVVADRVSAKASRILHRLYPAPPRRDHIVGRCILEGRVVHSADVPNDPRFLGNRNAFMKLVPFRAGLEVPLLRNGTVAGAIAVGRLEPKPFSKREIALLKTFADQAVIAMENARLFNETREALERQTATAEILKVISVSPTDVQPVFDALAETAARVCGANDVLIRRVEGDRATVVAHYGSIPVTEQARSVPITRGTVHGRAVLERRTIQVEDIVAEFERGEYQDTFPYHRGSAYRTLLVAPLLREGAAIGAIVVRRVEKRAFSEKQVALLETFANQAVIAIENVRLFNELHSTNRSLREALEQQTATSEILKVISTASSEVQPVFDAIVRSAVRLGGADFGTVFRLEGDKLHIGAHFNFSAEAARLFRSQFPQPVDRGSVFGRAIADGDVVNLEDVQEAALSPASAERARALGLRGALAVPMLHQGRAIGALAIGRRERGVFPDAYVALLKTFADQAVIAIENVRLFNETKEALEQQTAISEVLRVISNSPTDVKPVLDAVATRAARICEATDARIFLVEGEHYRHAAGFGDVAVATEVIPLNRDTPSGRAIIDRVPQHIHDIAALPVDDFPLGQELAGRAGWRTILSVPLLREELAFGTLVLRRREVRPFTEKQIALLKTFADQAAIAIENVRLFNETKEALERQTATAEILKVISSSPTDVQPVFDAIIRSAVQLCGGMFGIVLSFDGKIVDLIAHHNVSPQGLEAYRRSYPRPVGRDTIAGCAILDRAVINLAEARDSSVPPRSREMAEATGFRSVLVVPMLRKGEPIGVINVARAPSGPFSPAQVEILKTFADQAVIAIENVRLFNETRAALERQTATSEILRVISSSPNDVQPVFDTIVRNFVSLCGSMFGSVFRHEGGLVHYAGSAGFSEEQRKRMEKKYPVKVDDPSVTSARAIHTKAIVQVDDVLTDPHYDRDHAATAGWRRMLAVPMLRDDEPLGSIVAAWREPGATPKQHVELLKLFADQAVIAIENVRLFKELQQRTEALTRSVGQLTALGEVGRAISSTLDLETVLKTIVARAVQLTGLDAGAIYEYDERTEEFHLRAAENLSEEVIEILRSRPIRRGDGAVGGTALAREPIQVPETQDESYRSPLRDLILRTGRRALLAVPLMRDDHIIGALAVQRNTPGPFAPEVVELLKTFATQSALAIQNARLFREIAEKGRQLEVASRHKSDFLASMSHELRTPLNALLGFNEMILGDVYGEVPADMKPPLAQMQASGKHLLRLINNVLDLAKIEAGRMELALSDYSVHDTVESVRSTLSPLAADKGLQFLASVPADIPVAHGDAGRITQCLMNLAGNALKFTKAGKVEIAVACNDGWLRYSVADTGIGIPPEKIASLFTEFKQTDATIASEYGGTGLGLAITKKFVEMHGGRIWVESEAGRGSNFIFEVPLRAKAA